MSSEIALMGVEVRRRILTRTYAGVLAVFALFVWRTTRQMVAYGATAPVAYNAWDVFVGVFGGTQSPLPPAVVFPMLLVLLLGSSVVGDVASGLSDVVQTRLASPDSYWWVKCASALVVTSVTVAAVYAMSLLLGAAAGLDLAPSLSPAGGHPDAWRLARGVPPAYYSLPARADIVTHGLLVALYMTYAYTSVVVFTMGVTVRARSTHAPLAVGGALVASGLALSYAAGDAAASASLLTALTESSHRPIPALGAPPSHAVPWAHSVMLLASLLAVGLCAGAVLSPTRGRRRRVRARRGAALIALVLAIAASATGCAPSDFESAETPHVPPVACPHLTATDRTRVRRIAKATVALGAAVDGLNALWGPRYLRADDAAVEALLERRAARLDRALREARSLDAPPSLAQWYRLQYAPGLDHLQHFVDDAPERLRRRDHVGLRACLRHVELANAYLSSAGQTLFEAVSAQQSVVQPREQEGGSANRAAPRK